MRIFWFSPNYATTFKGRFEYHFFFTSSRGEVRDYFLIIKLENINSDQKSHVFCTYSEIYYFSFLHVYCTFREMYHFFKEVFLIKIIETLLYLVVG